MTTYLEIYQNKLILRKMNTQLKSLLMAAAFVLGLNLANAQMRIAHIASDSLIMLMPERDSAVKVLESEQKVFQDELQKMYVELQKLEDEFAKLNNDPNASKPIKEVKMRRIQDQESRIQNFQQDAQDAMQKRQQELLTPIINKVKKAIEEVAKEKGYNYVLDSSSGVLLFSQPSDDLMPFVKRKLNLK